MCAQKNAKNQNLQARCCGSDCTVAHYPYLSHLQLFYSLLVDVCVHERSFLKSSDFHVLESKSISDTFSGWWNLCRFGISKFADTTDDFMLFGIWHILYTFLFTQNRQGLYVWNPPCAEVAILFISETMIITRKSYNKHFTSIQWLHRKIRSLFLLISVLFTILWFSGHQQHMKCPDFVERTEIASVDEVMLSSGFSCCSQGSVPFGWKLCCWIDCLLWFLFSDVQEVTMIFNISMSTLQQFLRMVQQHKQTDDTNSPRIILSYVDIALLEMAENLYLSSFKQFGIENYLFVTPNSETAKIFHKKGINAAALWEEYSDILTTVSNYGTKNFGNKSIRKVVACELKNQTGVKTWRTWVYFIFKIEQFVQSQQEGICCRFTGLVHKHQCLGSGPGYCLSARAISLPPLHRLWLYIPGWHKRSAQRLEHRWGLPKISKQIIVLFHASFSQNVWHAFVFPSGFYLAHPSANAKKLLTASLRNKSCYAHE